MPRITVVAEGLIVTQPSVSAAVAELSSELGMPVTEREGRGVRPTAAGNAFAPFAAYVTDSLEEGRLAAREAAHLADAAAPGRPPPAHGRRDDRRRVLRAAAHARLHDVRRAAVGA
jgi:hypothetical protein